LVTGASGLLGSNFALIANKRSEKIIALYHTHPFEFPGGTAIKIDLRNGPFVRELVREYHPDWIVHCAALTNVDWCEMQRYATWKMNVEVTRQIASLAREIGAGLVYISTDSIFDGKSGWYSEESTPAPLNVYAESKLAGEKAVLNELDCSLIVRTNIYGWNAKTKESLAEWILRRLESGQSVPGFFDILFTPIFVGDLSEIILDMMKLGLKGVYHVAGSQVCSKYEFAVQMAATFGLNRELVQPATVVDAMELRAKRPGNTSLRSDKISVALGSGMPDIEAGLLRFKAMRNNARIVRN
jgi:dTDP-4-dehydrorhamnose reductase